MKILDVNDPKMQQKVERANTTDNRTRPVDTASSRWTDSNILQEKVELDYKRENMQWLAKKFVEIIIRRDKYGKKPGPLNLQYIVDGILAEVEKHQLKVNKGQKKDSKMCLSRISSLPGKIYWTKPLLILVMIKISLMNFKILTPNW